MARNIILLGDSIFDNASYVIGEPCVTEQLREVTSSDVEVSMLAVDGDYVADVNAQLRKLPEQATHLFVSAGGNDALRHYQTLIDDFLSSEELFRKWSDVQSKFRAEYRSMLKDVFLMSSALCSFAPTFHRSISTSLPS